MDKPQPGTPYKPLGRRLKSLRTKANESLAEASGAVEIDVRELAKFELGQSRPTEDVLLLLLSHFDVQDDEAVKLWEVAGYADKVAAASEQPVAIADQKIIFTDIVDIMVNNYGVVMNFMQNPGPGKQPTSVAKVGMSREHAKSVLQILQATLNQTEHINSPEKTDSQK